MKDIDDAYDRNIQTVEMNALNGALAVYMYKQFRGYYAGGSDLYSLAFVLKSGQVNRDYHSEVD